MDSTYVCSSAIHDTCQCPVGGRIYYTIRNRRINGQFTEASFEYIRDNNLYASKRVEKDQTFQCNQKTIGELNMPYHGYYR